MENYLAQGIYNYRNANCNFQCILDLRNYKLSLYADYRTTFTQYVTTAQIRFQYWRRRARRESSSEAVH